MCVVIGAAVPIPRTLVETMFTASAVFFGFLSYAWIIGSFTTALYQVHVPSGNHTFNHACNHAIRESRAHVIMHVIMPSRNHVLM